MRAPTMMLFSLILGASTLVYTAHRLQHLMDDPGPLAEPEPAPVEEPGPSLADRAGTLLADWKESGVSLYQEITDRLGAGSFSGRGGEDHTVITEETVETVWTWTNAEGERRFSREDPGREDARDFLHPRGEPLPGEQPVATPETPPREKPSRPADKTKATPEQHLRGQEDMDFREGLRRFRAYQRAMGPAEERE